MSDNIPMWAKTLMPQWETLEMEDGIHRIVASMANNGPVSESVNRFLDTNGDGTGTKSAIGNYAGSPVSFYIQPPAGDVYRLYRMLVHVEDVNTFDSGSYGNGIVLTNGITVSKVISGQTVQMTDGVSIKKTPHWQMFCYDVDISSYGLGNEHASVRWTFTKGGNPVRLVGDDGDRLQVVLNDDFTGLVDHHFFVQGLKE